MTEKILELLEDLLGMAKGAGADQVDAVHIVSKSLSVAQRFGKPEKLERSESGDIGLRVFDGKKQAIVSTSDTDRDALKELAERAAAMARAVPDDAYCGLAEPDQLADQIADLDMCDDLEPEADRLVDWANRAEAAALEVDGVTNSEGAEAGWGSATVTLAATNGFRQSYRGSHFSLSASVLAGEGTAMERDYDYFGAVHAEDLLPPETIGRSAGEKAVRRLNPRKIDSRQVPVIYDPRVSRSLLNHFASAVNGVSIARQTSFLKDRMDQPVFTKGVSIIDDPHRRRGLRSKPFDGEGVGNRRREVVQDGILRTWFLDLSSARQLGLNSTGHASRSTGSPPAPSASNLYMEAGTIAPKDMMREVGEGLYVTELIGFGVNGLTGDYSRGASGFWIENGEIAYPVSEITIAGNLKDMFLSLTPANDLTFRYGIDAPTIRVDGLTVAGK